MNTHIRWSGYLNMAAGLLLLAYWYLYAVLLPYADLSTTLMILVADKDWLAVNLLGASGALFGIVGLVGMFQSVGARAGKALTFGFILALLGSVLMFAALMRDTLLWPILAAYDPELLSFTGPIYTSKAFMPFFIFSSALYSLGYLVFGLALARAGEYPAWAGHFLAWGTLLFGLGPALGTWQVLIRSIGITLLSIGMVMIGWEMGRGVKMPGREILVAGLNASK